MGSDDEMRRAALQEWNANKRPHECPLCGYETEWIPYAHPKVCPSCKDCLLEEK